MTPARPRYISRDSLVRSGSDTLAVRHPKWVELRSHRPRGRSAAWNLRGHRGSVAQFASPGQRDRASLRAVLAEDDCGGERLRVRVGTKG